MPVSSHLSNSHLSNSQLSNSQLSTPPLSTPPISTPQLSIRTACSAADARSYIAHQYATYPFRLSGNLRLDPADSQRVYAYVMNASPGILSGDDLRWSVEVGDRTSLYLTDQSATKVYSRPTNGTPARLSCDFSVGAGAYLEYIPEPIILYKAADLTQRLHVTLHPQGTLVLSEIIVPGRLASGEFYQFKQFYSQLRVQTPTQKLCFVDNARLLGEDNRFKHSALFSGWPIMGNFVAVLPNSNLKQLAQALEDHAIPRDHFQMCSSVLPGSNGSINGLINGLIIRAIASEVSLIKSYQRHLLGCVRQAANQPPLPAIPK